MDKHLRLAIGALVVSLTLSACGSAVALKTGSLHSDPNEVGCYTSGTEGQLVEDATAGTAIVETQTGDRYLVTWPIGFTGRTGLLGGVDVVDKQGNVVAHTGDFVNLPGGYWTDGSFLACGYVLH